MLTKSEIVDIVEIIYFVPALPFTVWICIKHGFSREAGWLLLTILSLVRIIGAALGIAATKEPQNSGLLIGSLVLAGIGAATLVAAFTGIVNRIDSGSKQSPLSPRMRKLLQLMSIAAIILGSCGASNNDRSLTQAAIILILVQYLASVFVLSCSTFNKNAVLPSDKILFLICHAAIPFMLVRIIYSLGTAFSSRNSDVFSLYSNGTVAVAVRAVMGVAMEIVAVTFFIIGGMVAPKIAVADGSRQIISVDQQHKHDQETGTHMQYQY